MLVLNTMPQLVKKDRYLTQQLHHNGEGVIQRDDATISVQFYREIQ